MAQPGSHLDALKTYSNALGPHLGACGAEFVFLKNVLGGPVLHFEGVGAPRGSFLQFGCDIVKYAKTFEKLSFSIDISRISRGQSTSKLMEQLIKSIPECIGTPASPPGWEGLAGLAR